MTTTYLSSVSNTALQGHYAGIVTRAVAFGIDVLFIVAGFALGGTIAEYALSAVLGTDVNLSDAPIISAIVLAIWAFLYMAYPLSAAGRTLGMAIVGIRAVRADGHDLQRRQAVMRVLALPASFLLFCFGFLLILLRRDRRALHDLIAGTAIVYAWDARAARLRFLQKR